MGVGVGIGGVIVGVKVVGIVAKAIISILSTLFCWLLPFTMRKKEVNGLTGVTVLDHGQGQTTTDAEQEQDAKHVR